MTLWLLIAIFTLLSLALIAWPLLARNKEAVASTAAYDLQVYKKQLKEVSRDLERGVLSQEDAEAAEAEIGRRILQADAERQQEEGQKLGVRGARPMLLASLLLIPLGTFLTYQQMGSPDLPGVPYAERGEEIRMAQARQNQVSGMEDAIGKLEARLEKEPDNVEGWSLLGRSYLALQRYVDAVGAYERVVALDGGNPEAHSAFGEAQVLAARGEVTDRAVFSFERALELGPNNPRANFYLAQSDYQKSRYQAALDRLMPLIERANGTEPWLESLVEMAAGIAKDGDIDLGDRLPDLTALRQENSGKSAPIDPEQQAEIANMSPEEQQDLIRNMVDSLADRLEEEPNDPKGWSRLANAYMVLKQGEKALTAYDRLIEFSENKIDAMTLKARAIRSLNGNQPDQEVDRLMQEILKLDPNHMEAAWFSGLAALRSGDRDQAKVMFEKALSNLEPGSPDHQGMSAEIGRLLAQNGSG